MVLDSLYLYNKEENEKTLECYFFKPEFTENDIDFSVMETNNKEEIPTT